MITSFGPPDVLQPAERPKPDPQPQEIRIQVKAAGVARADLLQRQGKYPPPPGASDVPGLDVAGFVDAVGGEVQQFRKGDQVCAILSGGGYAEYCIVPAQQVLPIPAGWSFEEATTLPENLFTVYDNLVTRAALQSGETVLIHGGTSGIGSTAIMLARTLGATPYATAGTDEKCRACRKFGAEHAINYRSEDFVASIKQQTANRGVDVVLDIVGAPYLNKNIQALAVEGRLALVSMQSGSKAELDMTPLLVKRVRIAGSTMRARTAEGKGLVAQRLRDHIWPLLPGKQHIWPVIDRIFPLTEASRAHARMESGEHIGKIVLRP